MGECSWELIMAQKILSRLTVLYRVNMTYMFQRLFQSKLIVRSPFHCQCGAIKRRQHVSTMGWTMEANLQRPRRLEGIIAERLYDVSLRSDTPLCTVCGATASSKAEFYKYAYLPEVLIFSTSYVGDAGSNAPGAAWTNNFNARLTYPEMLDMSNLRDDPGREADRHCLYRLQSIIVSPNAATPMSVPGLPLSGVHFMAYLRRNETTWTLVDDIRNDTIQCDIATIRNHSYRPRLLMYVRVHPAENKTQHQDKGDTNDNSQSDTTKGAGGSGLADLDMGPFSEDEAPGDDSADSSPPKVEEDRPKDTPPPQGKGSKDITPPASTPGTKPQPEAKSPTNKDAKAQQSPKTDTPPAVGALGALDGDNNLYPPTKDLPPGQLMRIIRAAGARRDGLGRGSRRLLGRVQRPARPSIATRLAMSTRAGLQRSKR